MTHLVIHAHGSTASLRTPDRALVGPRAATAVLALLAAIAMVRGFEVVLNPSVPTSRVPTPTQPSPAPVPGFDS